MEPIRVPAPPKEAFNKHRRVSDLIRKQVHHFKHLEQKLPESVREQIPQHHVATEDEAAHYIAAITRVLRSGELQTKQKPQLVTTAPKPSARNEPRGLSLAAAGATGKPQSRSSKPAKPAGAKRKSAPSNKVKKK